MTFVPVALRKPLARDGAWLVGSALVARIFGTVAQVAMGIILARDDYLVWGIATSSIAILGSAKDGGAGKLLLQGLNRSATETKRSTVYGHRVAAGSTAGALLAAPAVGWFYNSSDITWLICIGAGSIALNGFSMPPKAKATVAGKYSDISRVQMFASLASTTSMICCALLGLGAFSFALALCVGGAVQLVGMLSVSKAAEVVPKTQPEVHATTKTERRWLLASTVATALIMNVDYMVLGAVAPEILAAYFFGFQLTLTLSVLVAPAMEQTLLPYFSGRTGQGSSIQKMLRTITFVVTPIGLAAVLLSPSVVRFAWGEKWLDAIPVIQIFSVGVCIRLLQPVLVTYLQSQRRWKQVAIFHYIDASLVLLATLGTARFGLTAVSAAVTFTRSVTIFSLLASLTRKTLGPLGFAKVLLPFALLIVITAFAVSQHKVLSFEG